ncbi:hypothetical protein DL89DRAFT_264131 [Linderina pennispora]|uniref:Aminopeptidase P N-terminal domain-containing protein n=1 Tax=Linderina pennispora TaxID=61395 RepID=A0A1Y1WKU7_9FUNG|nr:uncharacterized protein DL89DRAFT_264131 [Linderina pennispora]ORX74189.1 hypothetical protein DL89DRAFT_264131 [Linderina pennispora]
MSFLGSKIAAAHQQPNRLAARALRQGTAAISATSSALARPPPPPAAALRGQNHQLRSLHASALTQKNAAGGGLLSRLLQTAQSNNPITSQWYGQPVHETHPELVLADELTPGISAGEYETRRQALMSALPEGSSVVAFSARMFFVSPHVFHTFRQDSDFHYLCGWNEPDSVLVLEKDKFAARGYTMTIFANPKEPEKELWEGPRNGLEAAVDMFGADQARPIREFNKHAGKMLRRFKTEGSPCGGFAKLLKEEGVGSRIQRLTSQVQKLRLIKSPAEISLMREASRLSASAFQRIMRDCRPGLSEATLQGIFTRQCQEASIVDGTDRSPLTRPAYVPVFASGEHALCLHYVHNSGPVKDGDLILVDAGAEYASYAADITRTFPVNGRFTAPQRDLYSALLAVQEQMLQLCHASAGYSLNEIHRQSTYRLQQELRQIGFEVSARDIDDHLYPHHISHYLGMDVHDTVDMTRSQLLKPGMVVTVEPGVYVPYDSRFPKAFQGIGIRIEDDIVVGQTAADMENLSIGTPKTVEDIEALMNTH